MLAIIIILIAFLTAINTIQNMQMTGNLSDSNAITFGAIVFAALFFVLASL